MHKTRSALAQTKIDRRRSGCRTAAVLAVLLTALFLTACSPLNRLLHRSAQMVWEDGQLWYEDASGHRNTDPVWRKVDGIWYKIGEEGYALRNAWSGNYYLTEDGSMAADTWVDRFYVDETGKWAYNDWTEGHWRVDGHWEKEETGWVFLTSEGERQPVDSTQLRLINRLGYNTLAEDGLPQQSLTAYEAALKQGFSILLCDLRFTADGVPVCFHDETINTKARQTNGWLPGQTTESGKTENTENTEDSLADLYVSELICEELRTYDYGLYRGEQYRRTGLLTLEEMLQFCEAHQVPELYIEIKDGTPEQIASTVEMAAKYYSGRISWPATTFEQARAVIETDPAARVALMPWNIDDSLMAQLAALQTGQNEVFVFAYGNAILDADRVLLLQNADIAFEMGTIDSAEEIVRYHNGAYAYCSGIETNVVAPGTIDLDAILGSKTETEKQSQ